MHRLRHHRRCCHRCRRWVAAPIASAVGSAATCPGSGIVRGALRATDGLSLAAAIAWPGSGSGSGSAPYPYHLNGCRPQSHVRVR